MADRVLLGVAELGHGAGPVPVIGHEGRVVAKPTGTARRLGAPSPAATFEASLLSRLRIDVGDHANIRQRASRRDFSEQLVEVLLIAGVGSRVAGRVHARSP